MIGIIDYGLGNLASVSNIFENLGHEARLCVKPADAMPCDRLVLPGVGSFHAGMRGLNRAGWTTALRELTGEGRHLLGICLGMQLLASFGEEHGPSGGLDLIPGKISKLVQCPPYKVPHVGWNTLQQKRNHPIFSGVKPNVDFYFVHSYHFIPDYESDTLAVCEHERPFVAAVARGNIVGVQFHPEKSQPAGIKIIENFVAWDGTC